jgi:hypothetical protein
MYFKPLLYQSESQSFIFLILNILIVLFLICFIEPFSFVYLFVYSLILIFICRKLAHRQSYNIPKNTDLTGQTIIVTGAASGIGRVSAIECMGHCFVENGINYEFPSSSYDAKIAYGQSKLAQIWRTLLLQ